MDQTVQSDYCCTFKQSLSKDSFKIVVHHRYTCTFNESIKDFIVFHMLLRFQLKYYVA